MTGRAARDMRRSLRAISDRLPGQGDHLAEEAGRLASNFYSFVEAAWPHVDPQPFVHAWHLEAICEAMEGLTNGDYRNLIINVPPGHAKSIVASVMWPAWEWGPKNRPGQRYIASALGTNISTRDTDRCRALVGSEWYRERWGHRARINPDRNRADRVELTARGHRVATSVGSRTTGLRGDTVIFDDPHDLMDAYHPNKIVEAIRHFNDVLKNRGVGYQTRKLVIMQRVAPYDLTQDILEKMDEGGERFETLILPDRFEPTFQITFPNNLELGPDEKDRRNPAGKKYDPDADPVLLFPQLYPEHVIRDLRSSNADRADAIYGQRPRRDALGAFKERDLRYFYVVADEQTGAEKWGLDTDDGWKVYEEHEVWRVIGVDLAASLTETADFTCMEVWGITPDMELLLLDMIHGRIEGPDQIETLWALQSQWQAHACLIENTAYQLTFIQSAARAGLPGQAVKADRDKWTRSIPAQTLVRNHRVYLRAGAHFTAPMKEQLMRFPGPGKKDMVDPFAYVARALTMGELAAPDPAGRPPHQRPTRKFGPFSGPPPGGVPLNRAPPFG